MELQWNFINNDYEIFFENLIKRLNVRVDNAEKTILKAFFSQRIYYNKEILDKTQKYLSLYLDDEINSLEGIGYKDIVKTLMSQEFIRYISDLKCFRFLNTLPVNFINLLEKIIYLEKFNGSNYRKEIEYLNQKDILEILRTLNNTQIIQFKSSLLQDIFWKKFFEKNSFTLYQPRSLKQILKRVFHICDMNRIFDSRSKKKDLSQREVPSESIWQDELSSCFKKFAKVSPQAKSSDTDTSGWIDLIIDYTLNEETTIENNRFTWGFELAVDISKNSLRKHIKRFHQKGNYAKLSRNSTECAMIYLCTSKPKIDQEICDLIQKMHSKATFYYVIYSPRGLKIFGIKSNNEIFKIYEKHY